MKKCPQCGKSYSSEFVFCQDDGSDLIAEDTPPGKTPAATRLLPVSTPVGASAPVDPSTPVVAPATIAPVAGPNRPLTAGAVAVGVVLLLGAGMFVAGIQNRQRAAEDRAKAEEARLAAENAARAPSNTSDSNIENQSTANSQSLESVSKPSPKPDTAKVERKRILDTIDNWRVAWERQDVDAYMSNYAPDARIFSNKKWYSYSAYKAHERELFSYGGTIRVARGSTGVDIEGDTATVSFPLTFQRWGGKGDYRSRGRQTFKLHKRNSGQWVIYEDVFSKH